MILLVYHQNKGGWALDKVYTPLHMHSDASNFNMTEVINKYTQYVDKAVDLGMHSICFTEHGNTIGWYNKKKYTEEQGLKYIHASEMYLTWTLEEKIRDNYHITLIAKNFEGFKELNRLTSKSFNRKDGSFYYNPRITWNDIKNTSSNIIILSACLGGIIWQMHKSNDPNLSEVLDWMEDNKDRVFLEVQNHYHIEQIKYNKLLRSIANERGMKLVGTGDYHAVDEKSDEARKILQKAKRIQFSDEDSFKLHMKSYDELFNEFMKQGIWDESEIEDFLELTNTIAHSVEPFKLDYSKKYPKLYPNSHEVLQLKIAEGIKFREINKLPHEDKAVYAERIQHELDTYETNEAEDYLLLEDMVKTFARENDVAYGYGRGSVSGSIIAYLMQITEMDSIQRNLNFERFMNKERISLADVDSDYDPNKRYLIQDFLMNHPELYCAPIMTANTIALKGAIRDIGRGLEMSLSEVDEIAKGAEENEGYYRDKYPKLFKYVDIVIGTITSIGQHACGIAVSPIPLDENMGLITTSDSEYPLTMLNMKEIDAQNYVKLDILGLDTTSIISDTARLAGIPFPTPQTLDADDEKVWKSVIDSNISIFQWESDFAHQVYKDLFSDETIYRIRQKNPNFSFIDLLSLGNAILRPSGASYRDSVMQGEFYDNGHPALNEFLAPTLGRLVYQEQQMEFLVKFCGYTGGQADLVRRGIGKKSKEIIDNEVPKIESKFIETMVRDYELSGEEAEKIAKPFMQVFLDSANYGFSVNHSDAYSWMGYASAWLRYYYPLEFITASLNVNIGKEDKTNRLVEYAKSQNVDINPIKFRYSKAGYMFDKETNSIYQGIHPVKFLNSQVAEGLYELRNNNYNTFTDLLMDIKEATTIDIASVREEEIIVVDDDGQQHPKINYHLNFENPIVDSVEFKEYLSERFTKEDLKDIAKKEKIGAVRLNGSPIAINSRQMKILISLGFFSEFGNNKKLLNIYEAFDKFYSPKHKIKTKIERYAKVLQIESELEDERLSLVEQCTAELEFLGHAETIDEKMPPNIMMLVEVEIHKTRTSSKAYQFSTGEVRQFKMGSKMYAQVPFEERDVIEIINADIKPKNKKINGVWRPHPTEKEAWLKEVKFIRKG